MAKKYQIIGGFPSGGVDRAEVETIIEEFLVENPSIGAPGQDGKDGVSPTVSIMAVSGGYMVTITDAEGAHPFTIMHGAPGKDGTSPAISIEEVDEGYNLTITDIDGTETITLHHGKNADPNINPAQIEKAVADYLTENPPEVGVSFETDATLKLENGVLSVNTTDMAEQDNTLPITSAGVYATVGNIEALLKTI